MTNPTEHADLGGTVERLRKCANGVQRTFKGIDMIEVRVMLEAADTLEAQAGLIGEMAGELKRAEGAFRYYARAEEATEGFRLINAARANIIRAVLAKVTAR